MRLSNHSPMNPVPAIARLRSGDLDFLNWMNLFLETIKTDGRYEQLHKKYFKDLQ